MKRIVFRLAVVLLGQLCCLAIGLCSGALNVDNLPVKARAERGTAAGSPVTVAELQGRTLSVDLPFSAPQR